jgi:chemotaxis protein CheX
MNTSCSPTAAPSAPLVEVMVARLVEVTREIFQTMVDRTIDFTDTTLGGPQPSANVVATVGFAGSLSGYISLGLSQEAALEIAQALLGCEADEASAHVRDAAGEMANMVTGSMRTAMAERGESLGISTPIVTVGTDFSTAPMRDVSQAVLPFTMGSHRLFVYVVLQGHGRT